MTPGVSPEREQRLKELFEMNGCQVLDNGEDNALEGEMEGELQEDC